MTCIERCQLIDIQVTHLSNKRQTDILPVIQFVISIQVDRSLIDIVMSSSDMKRFRVPVLKSSHCNIGMCSLYMTSTQPQTRQK